MKIPVNIQTLKLADNLFPVLESDEKKVTIRTGHQDIHLGLLAFEAIHDPERKYVVLVWKVLWKRFNDLTDEEAKMDGAESVEELFKSMKRFYPDIDWSSEITYVEWQ